MANKSVKNKYFLQDGTPVLGTTTVLQSCNGSDKQAMLMQWAWKLGTQHIKWQGVRDGRAKIGSLAHDMIEQDIAGEFVDTEGYTKEEYDIAKKCYDHFVNWRESQKSFKILASEMVMVSEKHKFGGTCDLLYEKDGKIILADFKTSKGCYEEHKLQQCAYKILIEETSEYKVDGIQLLRINEEQDKLEVIEIKPKLIQLLTTKFLNILEIAKLDREIKGEK